MRHICLPMSVYHFCAGCLQRSGEGIRSSGLELQMVVSHSVGSGKQIFFLCKSSQCSQLQSHVSSPMNEVFMSSNKNKMPSSDLCRHPAQKG